MGNISEAQSRASANKYNAAVAEQNAVQARLQAASSAKIQREQSERLLGAQQAAYGASGITMEGTPLDVLANSATNAERDRQTIMYKGNLQAAGYQDQAQLDRYQATNELNQGYMKATGTLLGGASKAYAMKGGEE